MSFSQRTTCFTFGQLECCRIQLDCKLFLTKRSISLIKLRNILAHHQSSTFNYRIHVNTIQNLNQLPRQDAYCLSFMQKYESEIKGLQPSPITLIKLLCFLAYWMWTECRAMQMLCISAINAVVPVSV